ncbi:MAG: hypothetical protein AAFP89_25450 [Bacteroidota bacterium]
MKNFFVKNEAQAQALKESVENFGKQEISFLDNVIGGTVATGGHYPYARSTFYKIIIPTPPKPPKGGW